MNKISAFRTFSTNILDEIFPYSSVKKIRASESVNQIGKTSKIVQPLPHNNARFNEVNIQMISQNLYDQLFGESKKEEINSELIQQLQQVLGYHGMLDSKIEPQPVIDFKLPPLLGKNVEEHFQNIAYAQCEPYINIIQKFLTVDLPQRPPQWLFRSGWTKYTSSESVKIPYPPDDALVFDVEVCMSEGPLPTLACAVSKDAWYGWCSPTLVDKVSRPVVNKHLTTDLLIPLESASKQKPSKLSKDFQYPRVVIGHNVSYDRARVKEQYWLESTALRFVDTMSLHVCISGITSYQRAMLSSKSLKEPSIEDQAWMMQASLNSLTEVHKLYCNEALDKLPRNIFVEGNLNDVREDFQNLMNYCAGDVVATYNVLKKMFPLFRERFPHPATFAGMLEIGTAYLPVNSNWLQYISDCDTTYEDLDLEAKFLLSRRANQACKLKHYDVYKKDIWMWDQDWSTKTVKLKKAIKTKEKKSGEMSDHPTNLMDDKSKDTIDSVEADNIDETEENFKKLEQKFSKLFATHSRLPARRPLLPGYPAWYTKLCIKPNDDPDWLAGPNNISTSMQITPKLLRLSWEGYPLHYIRGHGWGFLVPHRSTRDESDTDGEIPLDELVARCPVVIPNSLCATEEQSDLVMDTLWKNVQENISKKEYWKKPKKKEVPYKGTGVWCNIDLEGCVWFVRLPHKDGVSKKVGNPLARDFLNKFSENVLAGDDQCAEKVIMIARKLSYWRNNNERIKQQMVVWLKKEELSIAKKVAGMDFGAIIPQIVVCGTLTRRAMEATWLTASNAQHDRVGSELRAMVQAPPGYSFVGADVDSQELWIASVIGDSYAAGLHGATPFGWMTLSGSKAQGTDMHSVTAKAIGISRDHAKVINYARIYGAGQNFAEQLLKQFNPTMTATEARGKASKMFALTKGKRVYNLKTDTDDIDADIIDRNSMETSSYNKSSKGFTGYQALKIAASQGKSVTEMFGKPKWEGGTESAMFNRLEEIAGAAFPITPFLECRLSRALEPSDAVDTDRFLPTRVNWVVQSGAVDYLHLMLVSMRHLMGTSIRFCLSFHDEVRYLVKDDRKYEAALAMHITNLLTRTFCAQRLGLQDLPQSVAFFSSVEVDRVLRKEASADCVTPSNPRGLHAAYGIPPGESLDIEAALKKAEEEKATKQKLSERKKIIFKNKNDT